MLVAIHQPNFFPWLGYFDKIRRADTFVFLDQVAYPRKGSDGMGSWVNRVQLCVQGDAKWVTCPVKRVGLGTAIQSVEIDDTQSWRIKLHKTLIANYGRAPNFESVMALLLPLIESTEHNLAAFNITAIRAIAAHLGLATHFTCQSKLAHHGAATDLLISLVKAAGGNSYLAGGGAAGYQKDAAFSDAGVGLIYQNFAPSPYGDPARFLPGLSIIDYLMHDGRPLTEALLDRPT